MIKRRKSQHYKKITESKTTIREHQGHFCNDLKQVAAMLQEDFIIDAQIELKPRSSSSSLGGSFYLIPTD